MLYNTFAFLYIESCRRIFTPPPPPPSPSSGKINREETRENFFGSIYKKEKRNQLFFLFLHFSFHIRILNVSLFLRSRIFHISYFVSLFPGKNFLSNYLIYILIGRQTRWSNWFGLITNEIHERSAASRLFSSEWRVESPLVKWVIE